MNRKPYSDMSPEEQDKVLLQHRIQFILGFIVMIVVMWFIVKGVQL